MEIKNSLNKPYSEKQKMDFIVENNHRLGYAITEREWGLEAWGYTEEEQQEQEAQAEAERKARLSLTKREVFLALYKDKGITPEQIKAQITSPEALIEFEYANDYFRGNPLIDIIGTTLGYTSEDLDYLFEHKELPIEENDELPDLSQDDNIKESEVL